MQTHTHMLPAYSARRSLSGFFLTGLMVAFLGAILDLPPGERLEGTIAAAVLSVERGAHILRVHDVGPVARAVRAAEAVLGTAGAAAGGPEVNAAPGKDGHVR